MAAGRMRKGSSKAANSVTARTAKGPQRRVAGELFKFLSTPLEQEIVSRYADQDEGGTVVRCGRLPVFTGWAAAQDCARQLQVARGRRTHSYWCEGAWPGHCHVAAGGPKRNGDR